MILELYMKHGVHIRIKESGTMDQLLNFYEKNIKELKKQGIILPAVDPAMQHINSVGLDKNEKQIVLRAVSYTKKEEMYEQMKNALRKFFVNKGMSYRQKKKIRQLLKKNLSTQQTQRKHKCLELKIVIEEQDSKDTASVVHG